MLRERKRKDKRAMGRSEKGDGSEKGCPLELRRIKIESKRQPSGANVKDNSTLGKHNKGRRSKKKDLDVSATIQGRCGSTVQSERI